MRILIVQKSLTHYRLSFYHSLVQELKKGNNEVFVIYGKDLERNNRKDQIDYYGGIYKRNFVIKIMGITLYWQPILGLIKKGDLVIVEQANKLLVNYILMILNKFRFIKLAFWGHAYDHSNEIKSYRNKFKDLFINSPFWWFAYTKGVAEYIKKKNFPSENITILNNSIDTQELMSAKKSIRNSELDELRIKYNIDDGPVGIFCGGLYKDKKIGFLLKSALMIRKKIHNFEILIIGDGDLRPEVELFCSQNKWAHYFGSVIGHKRAPLFMLSKVLLMPGKVGLVVIDSFVFNTPIITTNISTHSPEFEYINNFDNGVVVEENINKYSETVIEVIENKKLYSKLVHGCMISANQYTLANMVSNFVRGISQIGKK